MCLLNNICDQLKKVHVLSYQLFYFSETFSPSRLLLFLFFFFFSSLEWGTHCRHETSLTTFKSKPKTDQFTIAFHLHPVELHLCISFLCLCLFCVLLFFVSAVIDFTFALYSLRLSLHHLLLFVSYLFCLFLF